MSLDSLPVELLLQVTSYFEATENLKALIQTSRHFHARLNHYLYIRSVSKLDFSGIFWAAKNGPIGTLEHFFAAAVPGLATATAWRSDVEWIEAFLIDKGLLGVWKGDMFERILTFPYAGRGYSGDKIPIVSLYREALIEAVKHGQIEATKALLKQIPWDLHEIDEYDKWGWCHLSHLAAQYNQPAMTEFLAENGVNLLFHGEHSEIPSPLHLAIMEGHREVFMKLLQHNLNLETLDMFGRTPLILAITHGCEKLVKALLDKGADLCKKFQQFTPLFLATLSGRARTLKILLDAGLSPDGPSLDFDGNVLNYVENIFGGNFDHDIYERMTDGMDELCHSPNFIYLSPLCIAADNNHHEAALCLLEYGADPNGVDPNGQMPLHIALERKNLETAAILLQNGASVDLADDLGNNPFHYALVEEDTCSQQYISKAVQLLLSRCSQEVRDRWIFRVLEYGHSAIGVSLPPNIVTRREPIVGPSSLSCLGRRGLRADYHDSVYQQLYETKPYQEGYSAFTRNCECEKILKVFVDHGSSVHAQDSLGRTLLHQAAYWMCTETTHFILARQGNPLVEDSFSQTPFHLAVVHTPEDPERIDEGMWALLKRGAALNLQDGNGRTPLHMAAQVGNHWAVELILGWYTMANTLNQDDEADQDSETDWVDLAEKADQAALIRRAEDVGIRDNNGSTPFHLAAMSLPSECALILNFLDLAAGRCTCKTLNGDSNCERMREVFSD
ncbi:hypothetical protein N7454_001606 [Penicillium verhagenii]|nr:hypothetical protein N7454_001606 [Penicillium verhagenii]